MTNKIIGWVTPYIACQEKEWKGGRQAVNQPIGSQSHGFVPETVITNTFRLIHCWSEVYLFPLGYPIPAVLNVVNTQINLTPRLNNTECTRAYNIFYIDQSSILLQVISTEARVMACHTRLIMNIINEPLMKLFGPLMRRIKNMN